MSCCVCVCCDILGQFDKLRMAVVGCHSLLLAWTFASSSAQHDQQATEMTVLLSFTPFFPPSISLPMLATVYVPIR